MKIISILVLSSVVLYSCSKGNEVTTIKKKEITNTFFVGKWQCYDNKFLQTTWFNADSTFKTTWVVTSTGTYSYKGPILTFIYNLTPIAYQYDTISINDSNTFITSNNNYTFYRVQ